MSGWGWGGGAGALDAVFNVHKPGCNREKRAFIPSYRRQNNQHVDCGPLNERRRKHPDILQFS